MSQLSTQVQIKAPADKLWKVLVDLDSLSQWVPDNANSETASQNSEIITTPWYYDANPFPNAEDRAIGWQEGHHYAYEVKNIGPIRSAYNRFSLNPVGEGETVLTQTLDFQMKLGPSRSFDGHSGFPPPISQADGAESGGTEGVC